MTISCVSCLNMYCIGGDGVYVSWQTRALSVNHTHAGDFGRVHLEIEREEPAAAHW